MNSIKKISRKTAVPLVILGSVARGFREGYFFFCTKNPSKFKCIFDQKSEPIKTHLTCLVRTYVGDALLRNILVSWKCKTIYTVNKNFPYEEEICLFIL